MVPQGTGHQALAVAPNDTRYYCNFLTKLRGELRVKKWFIFGASSLHSMVSASQIV